LSATGYRWALRLFTFEGKDVGKASVSVNWGPAREAVRLLGVRRGLIPADARSPDHSVLPLWHPRLGRPYVEGFRLSCGNGGQARVFEDFPITYFMQSAMRARLAFVELGKLRRGESFLYHVLADPEKGAASGAARTFRAERVIPALPLRNGDLAGTLASASPRGEPQDGDLPVFLPRAVLDEVGTRARAGGERETGGFLIGHLCRDESVPELFARVTAQVPARHTDASTARLSFTPETWTAAEAAIALRGRGEIPLAWWHSHPLPGHCLECPPEKRGSCSRALDFFSEQDETVHRAMFAAAYCTALVATGQPGGDFGFSLYGWRKGLIEPRGFHVTDEPTSARPGEGGADAIPARRSR
jgi:hypothetical protein